MIGRDRFAAEKYLALAEAFVVHLRCAHVIINGFKNRNWY